MKEERINVEESFMKLKGKQEAQSHKNKKMNYIINPQVDFIIAGSLFVMAMSIAITYFKEQ